MEIAQKRQTNQTSPIQDFRHILDVKHRQIKWWRFSLQHWQEVQQNFPQQVKKMVCKGIPELIRPRAWQVFVQMDQFYKQRKVEYKDLLLTVKKKFESIIIKDIPRTYPKHLHFQISLGEAQLELYKVLRAYSNFNTQIGYLQSMGFITALFLTQMGEEQSFWMLASCINKFGLTGYFSADMPKLQLAFYIHLKLMKKHLPTLYQHFFQNLEQRLHPSVYATQWFLTLMSVNCKFEVLQRIWDICFYDGLFENLHRFGIAILKLKEKELLKENFGSIINSIKKFMKDVDGDLLVSTAMKYDFGGNKFMRELGKEYETDPDMGILDILGISKPMTKIKSID